MLVDKSGQAACTQNTCAMHYTRWPVKKETMNFRSIPNSRPSTGSRKPPPDWRRPVGRPRRTWLRAVESNLRPLNTGLSLSSSWRKATNRDAWRSVRTRLHSRRVCHETKRKIHVAGNSVNQSQSIYFRNGKPVIRNTGQRQRTAVNY